jgi:hypothetical protein
VQSRGDIPWEEAKQRCREENARLAARPQGHDGEYFVICTVYYTPLESGFTAERGFDVTPMTKPGLSGHTYPKDFLRAVKLEGYGRITTPVKGRSYIYYNGNDSYAFGKEPTGRGILPLEARRSAAVKLRQARLHGGLELETIDPAVAEVFGNSRWKIIDTGGGLKAWQLDLYWGEDKPRAPDAIGRPRGTDFEYAYSLVKVIAKAKNPDQSAGDG